MRKLVASRRSLNKDIERDGKFKAACELLKKSRASQVVFLFETNMTLTIWIARELNGELFAFPEEPVLGTSGFSQMTPNRFPKARMPLPAEAFPELAGGDSKEFVIVSIDEFMKL